MLAADQPPAFSHRRVDADVTGIVQQVQCLIVDDATGQRVDVHTLLQAKPLDQRFDLLPLSFARDRMVQAQPDIGRLACGKPCKSFDGQIDALSLVEPAGVEDDEGVMQIPDIAKHLSLCFDTPRRRE